MKTCCIVKLVDGNLSAKFKEKGVTKTRTTRWRQINAIYQCKKSTWRGERRKIELQRNKNCFKLYIIYIYYSLCNLIPDENKSLSIHPLLRHTMLSRQQHNCLPLTLIRENSS